MSVEGLIEKLPDLLVRHREDATAASDGASSPASSSGSEAGLPVVGSLPARPTAPDASVTVTEGGNEGGRIQ